MKDYITAFFQLLAAPLMFEAIIAAGVLIGCLFREQWWVNFENRLLNMSKRIIYRLLRKSKRIKKWALFTEQPNIYSLCESDFRIWVKK